jgi:hypothetical protein
LTLRRHKASGEYLRSYDAVLAFGRAVLTVFCENEFVLRAQTRFHAFPMNVGSKTGEELFILRGLLMFDS